jgi:prevent-host-death family protein
MSTVGIRELKEQASKLIRRVRERGDVIEITYRGKVVALLVPARRPVRPEDEDREWRQIDRLAAEIGARWPAGISAVDAVTEGRR